MMGSGLFNDKHRDWRSMWAYIGLTLFSLSAACAWLRIAMFWTTRQQRGVVGSLKKWKQEFVIAAVLFFALGVAALIWPNVAKQ
jgi:hypothetical protein